MALREGIPHLNEAASAVLGKIPELAVELLRITVAVGAGQEEGSGIRQPPGGPGRPCGGPFPLLPLPGRHPAPGWGDHLARLQRDGILGEPELPLLHSLLRSTP